MFGTILSAATPVTPDQALTQLGSIVSSCIEWIESNIILMTCFVAGLIPAGFMVIRKAKKASKA